MIYYVINNNCINRTAPVIKPINFTIYKLLLKCKGQKLISAFQGSFTGHRVVHFRAVIFSRCLSNLISRSLKLLTS